MDWTAAIGTIIAASLLAFDLGRRASAYGFVLFCAVALLWVATAYMDGAWPLVVMNTMLFFINAWGVYQYWLHPKNKDDNATSGDSAS